MEVKAIWSSLSIGIALCALLLNIRVAVRCWQNLKQHYFFLFFFTSTTIYLHISPALSLISNVLENLRSYVDYYIFAQALSLLFFQLPLYLYYFRQNSESVTRSILLMEVSRNSARLLVAGITILGILFLSAVIGNDLIFSRIGSEHLAIKIVDLPFYDFVVIRTYQESFYFLLGIVFFVVRFASDKLTYYLTVTSLITNVAIWIVANVLNSRASIIMMCIVLLGYWLTVTKYDYAKPKNLIMAGVLCLAALYLSTVAINVRLLGFRGQIEADYFIPNLNLLGDAQGVDRLNGIDLIARLLPELNDRGAAWGAAWSHVWWNIGRFIDPKGFDAIRLSMANTSKNYLMWEYLGWNNVDYYSCALTDLVGNFHVLGFLLGAVIFGFTLKFCCKSLHFPKTGRMFLVGLFMVSLVLFFEQESSTLLFGWIRKLPVLLIVIVLNPFKSREELATVLTSASGLKLNYTRRKLYNQTQGLGSDAAL